MLQQLVSRLGRIFVSRSTTALSNGISQNIAAQCGPRVQHNYIVAKCFGGETSIASLSPLIAINLGRNNCIDGQQPIRQFHAAGSKVRYLDFRYRLRTHHLRTHMLIIKRQKMKKHQRTKFRRKFKSLLAKRRLKREIAKEKAFRVELLTIIKRAEEFDPREYALRKIAEVNDKPREKTRDEKLEEIKELIRINRYQVDYIKPKHRALPPLDVRLQQKSEQQKH